MSAPSGNDGQVKPPQRVRWWDRRRKTALALVAAACVIAIASFLFGRAGADVHAYQTGYKRGRAYKTFDDYWKMAVGVLATSGAQLPSVSDDVRQACMKVLGQRLNNAKLEVEVLFGERDRENTTLWVDKISKVNGHEVELFFACEDPYRKSPSAVFLNELAFPETKFIESPNGH